jgi:hypothetical protein
MKRWHGGEIEGGRGKEIAGGRDVQRDGVGFGGDGDFDETAGHGAVVDGLVVERFCGRVAAAMVRTVRHIGHRVGLSLRGGILAGRGGAEWSCEAGERASHEAGEDG